MHLIDSHAHLDFIDDLEGTLKRASDENVGKIVTIGTSLDSSKEAIGIAEKFSNDDLKIFATCGLHPKDAKEELKKGSLSSYINSLTQIVESSKKVVAVGECGLDYYLETSDQEKEFQRELFEAQIKLAKELSLPLVIHCRNGWDEIFGILKKILFFERSEKLISSRSRSNNMGRGVFHSWTGDWKAAQKALDLNFYISFSGIVTFKNAPAVQEVAKKTPIARILIETDSPYLAPEPFRGKKNEPKNVRIIADFLAKLRSEPADEISAHTSTNAQKLFNLL